MHPFNSITRPEESVRPINEDDAALRNSNGAGISLFSNQVRINIAQAYLEPSAFYPHGGFSVNIVNEYCLPVWVTFTLPNGQSYNEHVSAHTQRSNVVIPRNAAQGAVLHVSIEDAFLARDMAISVFPVRGCGRRLMGLVVRSTIRSTRRSS